MGEALVRGLIGAGTYAPGDVVLCDSNVSRVEKLAEELGARTANSALEAAAGADAVLLAVKPKSVAAALEPLRDALLPTQILISVAAGVSISRLEACFSAQIPVIRVMPNTPSLVGAGASGFCGGSFARTEHLELARLVFGAVGLAVETSEPLLDAVTGLSGSGPAYVFLFIEALADGGVQAGLPRATALQLAAQTVMGAAKMLLESGDHPGVLKDRVASPGGTTIAGLHALESGAFRGVVMDAVMASAQRSKEMNAA